MTRAIPYIQLIWIGVLAWPLIFNNWLAENGTIAFLLPVAFILWSIGLCIRKYNSTPTSNVLTLLLLWLILTLYIAIDKTISYPSIAILLIGIAFYLFAIHAPWLRTKPQGLAWVLIIFSGFLTIISPPLIAWKKMRFRFLELPIYDVFQSLQFGQTETIHANVIAGALILLLPIVVALLLHSSQAFSEYHRVPSFFIKLGLFLISLSMLILVILTQSRGAYLGLIVALSTIFLLRWSRLIYFVPVVFIAISFFVYALGLQGTFELLGADNTFGGTADFRLVIWTAARKAINDFSLTGIGIGSFTIVMPLLYPNQYIESDSATHAHNLFLQTGLDLGLPGLTFYWLFVVGTLGMAFYTLRYQLKGFNTNSRAVQSLAKIALYRALIHGSIGALLGMLVHGLLDAVTWNTKLAFVPWLVYSLISVIYLSLMEPAVLPKHTVKTNEPEFDLQWTVPAQ